jgi:lipoprotein-releasing system ATP-binding protein
MLSEKIALEAQGLWKVYSMPRGDLTVLADLEFRPRSGLITAIVGASGVGKSTLLHILGTLDRPTRGVVRFEGEDLFQRSSRELARFRNRSIGFVFQFHYLLPEFNALENVMMPGLIARRRRYDVETQARNLLETVGIEDRAEHRPAELSGGEQQRVAVARALINEPAMLLADEPSGNLDRTSSQELHGLLGRLVRDHGQTTVVATHDERLAARADEVYRLEGGKLHLLRAHADKGKGA